MIANAVGLKLKKLVKAYAQKTKIEKTKPRKPETGDSQIGDPEIGEDRSPHAILQQSVLQEPSLPQPILPRRLYCFGGALAGSLGVAAVITVLQAPTYQSSMQLLVEPNGAVQAYGSQPGYAEENFQQPTADVDYLTQIRLMRSKQFIEQAIESLEREYPDLCEGIEVRADCVQDFQDNLTLVRLEEGDTKTRVVEAVFTGETREQARKFLLSLQTIYRVYNVEKQQERLNDGLAVFDHEVVQGKAVLLQQPQQIEPQVLQQPQVQQVESVDPPPSIAPAQPKSMPTATHARHNSSPAQDPVQALAQAPVQSRMQPPVEPEEKQQRDTQKTEQGLNTKGELVTYLANEPTSDAPDKLSPDKAAHEPKGIELAPLAEQNSTGAESVVISEVYLEATPALAPEMTSDFSLDVKSGSKLKAQPQAQTQAQPKIQTQTQPKAETAVEPSAELGVEPEIEPEVKPETKPATNPEANTETVPETPVEKPDEAPQEPAVKTQQIAVSQLLQMRQTMANDLIQSGFTWKLVEYPMAGRRISPRPQRNLFIGAVTGLLLGGLITFSKDVLEKERSAKKALEKDD